MKKKEIFNQASTEKFNEAKILNGNPNGIFNFNKTNHVWAKQIYDNMKARTWFPAQVDISKDKKNYPLLTEDDKLKYDLTLAQLISNDSIQVNQLMDRINSYITSPIVNACLSVQAMEEANHCLIDGTEILTSEGFIDFKDLKYSDKVANYYPNGEISFSHPTDIINSDYEGIMYEFSMYNYKQIVTPNHRMVKRNTYYNRVPEYKRGVLEIEFAEDANITNYDLPIAGYNVGSTHVLTPIERLAIAYQADGCIMNNKEEPTRYGFSYQFGFKRQDKIDRMQTLLNMCNIRFTRTETPNDYTNFYIWTDMKFDKEFDWVTLENKSSLYIMSFLDELMRWDGSKRSDDANSILYTNTNRKAIDKVIALATIGGCQTGLYYIDPNKESLQGHNVKDCWQIHIVMGKDYKTGREIKKGTINYKGKIRCCTVNSGMIICRYEDNVFITGNSDCYAVMAEDICADTDRIYDMHNHDDELKRKNEAVKDLYDTLYTGETPTNEDILLGFVANQVLEELVFPGGFIAMYSLEKQMPGSSEMIAEINVASFPAEKFAA